MGKWSREELERAFENYQRLALEAGTSGNWDAWSEQFTEDATYIEHLYGTMGGRDAIRRWISTTMAAPINCEMKYFPIEWYMIDEEKGWVIGRCGTEWSIPATAACTRPTTSRCSSTPETTKWSYEEDIYNPAHFKDMVRGWMDRKKKLAEGR